MLSAQHVCPIRDYVRRTSVTSSPALTDSIFRPKMYPVKIRAASCVILLSLALPSKRLLTKTMRTEIRPGDELPIPMTVCIEDGGVSKVDQFVTEARAVVMMRVCMSDLHRIGINKKM